MSTAWRYPVLQVGKRGCGKASLPDVVLMKAPTRMLVSCQGSEQKSRRGRRYWNEVHAEWLRVDAEEGDGTAGLGAAGDPAPQGGPGVRLGAGSRPPARFHGSPPGGRATVVSVTGAATSHACWEGGQVKGAPPALHPLIMTRMSAQHARLCLCIPRGKEPSCD